MAVTLSLIGYFIIAIIAIITVKLFIFAAPKLGLIDVPNARSSHEIPKPRGGGVVFVSLWLVFTCILFWMRQIEWRDITLLLPVVIVMGGIGFLDDRLQLSPRVRFGVQFIVAVYLVTMLGGYQDINLGIIDLPLLWLGGIIATLAIIWSINLFNFMDGLDGFAAVEALFIYGVGGLLLWLAGSASLALLSWVMVACVFGFLVWNWPPAKIFMGDVGSVVLGLLVIPLAIAGAKWFSVPVISWLILYSVFLVDATLTLLRRLLHGERVYEAHCSHAYQRLFQSGWSRRKILFALIGLNSILSLLAIWSDLHRGWLLWSWLLALTISLGAYWLVELRKPMYSQKIVSA